MWCSSGALAPRRAGAGKIERAQPPRAIAAPTALTTLGSSRSALAPDRRRQRRDVDRRLVERRERGAHRRGLDRRQVALDVDDDVVAPSGSNAPSASKMRSEPEAWSAPRHHGAAARRLDRGDDRGIVGGDQHRADVGLDARAARHARSSARREYRRAACPAAGSRPCARE